MAFGGSGIASGRMSSYGTTFYGMMSSGKPSCGITACRITSYEITSCGIRFSTIMFLGYGTQHTGITSCGIPFSGSAVRDKLSINGRQVASVN